MLWWHETIFSSPLPFVNKWSLVSCKLVGLHYWNGHFKFFSIQVIEALDVYVAVSFNVWCPSTSYLLVSKAYPVNTLRPRQDGRHFPANIFKWSLVSCKLVGLHYWNGHFFKFFSIQVIEALEVYVAVSFNVWCPSTSYLLVSKAYPVNTLRPRQDGRHFPDNIFKRIFLNENVRISIKISLKFVLKGPINNIPALVQTMAWHQPSNKPLSEPMMILSTDASMRHSASMS